MSSDWIERDADGVQWYENTITGETSYELPLDDIPLIDNATGGVSGYSASADDAWQEDTTGFQWDDATGEWIAEENWNPAEQTGLYDFTQGYYGEDGMWYDDDNIPPSPENSTVLNEAETEIELKEISMDNYINETDYGDMDETGANETGYVDEASGIYYGEGYEETGGYWGEDGEWHDDGAGGLDETEYFDAEGDYGGHWGEDGEWHADAEAAAEEAGDGAYVDEDGNYYDTNGYWDENGEWQAGEGGEEPEVLAIEDEEATGYVDADGNQYDAEGYWGDDGEWHAGENATEASDEVFIDADGNQYDADGYWGDDGEWHAGENATEASDEVFIDADGNQYDAEGYWGDDGEWHSGGDIAANTEETGYVDEDGNYYDAGGGYWDEDGEWQDGTALIEDGEQTGYVDEDGNYYDEGGYWDEDGEWQDTAVDVALLEEEPQGGNVVITVLGASGLHGFRLMEIEDSYERASIASLFEICKPLVVVGFIDSSIEHGRTPVSKGRNPDWTIKQSKLGITTSIEGNPQCRFEFEVPADQMDKIKLEVWDEQGSKRQFMGRVVVSRPVAEAAAFYSFDDGGVGETLTLLLEGDGDSETKPKGVLTFRVDPIGAPTASGLSPEELGAARLALFAMDAEMLAAEIEAQRLAAEATELAKEKAEMEAKRKALAEEEKNRPPVVMPGTAQTSALELKWPVADVYIADALRNYTTTLDEAGFSDKDLKKYESFLREPIQWGQPGLRSGAMDWHKKELETIRAVREALKSGLGVIETEELVLHKKKLWHNDITDASINHIPLNTANVQLDMRNPTKLVKEVNFPLAPTMKPPHVMDSPRTQLRKVEEANMLLQEIAQPTTTAPHQQLILSQQQSQEEGGRGGEDNGDRSDQGSAKSSSKSSKPKMIGNKREDPKISSSSILDIKGDHLITPLMDEKGMLVDPKLPGLTASACYPWKLMKHIDKTTQREVEFYYNVETKRSKWDQPSEGAIWERKLELLQQLTPRPVDPTAAERGLVKGHASDPDRWMWRETDAESRKRQRYVKDRDRAARAEQKRRREKPNTREQVADVLNLMVRAVVERDSRLKNKIIRHRRRKARLAWHPASLGRPFDKLPIYHINNPATIAPPLPPPPPNSMIAATASIHDEDNEEEKKELPGLRLVTDMDLSPLVDGIKTTAFAGRLPMNPSSRPRPPGYIPPKLATILHSIELEGTSWFDRAIIKTNNFKDKMKEHQENAKQKKLDRKRQKEEEDDEREDSDDDEEEDDSEEDSEDESDDDEEDSQSTGSGWLPKITSGAQKVARVMNKTGHTMKSIAVSSYAASSRLANVVNDTTEKMKEKRRARRKEEEEKNGIKRPKKLKKKLAITPEEKRKKSNIEKSKFVDVSGFSHDSASLTMELACPLPPRFKIIPNPNHEDNMNPVKKALHQALMKRKLDHMERQGLKPQPPKIGEQDEFNPTLTIFDTSERDSFCSAIVSDVARALGIPRKYVIIDEISGTRQEREHEETGEMADVSHAYYAAADEEYSDSEEEEEENAEEGEDEEECGSGESNDGKEEERVESSDQNGSQPEGDNQVDENGVPSVAEYTDENDESGWAPGSIEPPALLHHSLESGVTQDTDETSEQRPQSQGENTTRDKNTVGSADLRSQATPSTLPDYCTTPNVWNPWPDVVRDTKRRPLLNPHMFQSWLQVSHDDEDVNESAGGTAAAIMNAVNEAQVVEDEEKEKEAAAAVINDNDALEAVEALIADDMFNFDNPSQEEEFSSNRKFRKQSTTETDPSIDEDDDEEDEDEEEEDEDDQARVATTENELSEEKVFPPLSNSKQTQKNKSSKKKKKKSKDQDKTRNEKEIEQMRVAIENKKVKKELSAFVKKLLTVASIEEKAEANDAEIGASSKGTSGALGVATDFTCQLRREQLMHEKEGKFRTMVKLTILGTQYINLEDKKQIKKDKIETAMTRLNHLVNQVRQKEPPFIIAMRHHYRTKLRRLVQDRNLDLKKKLAEVHTHFTSNHKKTLSLSVECSVIQAVFQKRRKKRMHELMTKRIEQVTALKKTETKLLKENAKSVASIPGEGENGSTIPKLPKLGEKASQSRRAVKAAQEAAQKAELKRKAIEEKNQVEMETFNIAARKSQVAYDKERSLVMERLMAKESFAQGELTIIHNTETLQILREFTAKYEDNIIKAKEKIKFEDGTVTHPNQLERTLLLEGKITCTVLSVGNIRDNTALAYPEKWEGFWCNILHPIYFGRKSSGKIAGTIVRKRIQYSSQNSSRTKPSSSSSRNIVPKPPSILRTNSQFSNTSSIDKDVTSMMKSFDTSMTSLKSKPGTMVCKDIYTGKRLVPDTRPGAKAGAMILAQPKKKKILKPKFRKPDPADIYREADAYFKKLISSGKGVVIGMDGQEHLTAAALFARNKKDRAKKNVRMRDIQVKRKDEREGKIKGPWNVRPRKRKPKIMTSFDVAKMEKRNDAELRRKRKDRLKAMHDAKMKRALEAKKLKRRAKIESWLIKKLMELDSEPELFKEAMEAESKREKEEELGAHATNGKAMEISSEELGRKASELRAKRVAKETCEYAAKELFRDIRRNFEKLSLDRGKTDDIEHTVSRKKSRKALDKQSDQSTNGMTGILPTGEPVEGWVVETVKRNTTNNRKNTMPARRTMVGKAPPGRGTVAKPDMNNPVLNVVPNAGDDDCALSGIGIAAATPTANTPASTPASSKPGTPLRAGTAAESTAKLVPELLVHKRALMEALKEKDGAWLPRGNAIKGLRPLMSMKVFEIAFLLHPVEAHRGHVTAEELGVFAVAVHCVIDRYMRVRERLAEIARKKEEEKNLYTLAAERRKLEEEAKAAIFEATRREALLKLQQDMVAARSDPHLADDAWAKFHIHIIVKPLDAHPSYCCTCRRRKWEMQRNSRLKNESLWRNRWPGVLEELFRKSKPGIERRARRMQARPQDFVKPQKRLPLHAQVFNCISWLVDQVESKCEIESSQFIRNAVSLQLTEMVEKVSIEESNLKLKELEWQLEILIARCTRPAVDAHSTSKSKKKTKNKSDQLHHSSDIESTSSSSSSIVSSSSSSSSSTSSSSSELPHNQKISRKASSFFRLSSQSKNDSLLINHENENKINYTQQIDSLSLDEVNEILNEHKIKMKQIQKGLNLLPKIQILTETQKQNLLFEIWQKNENEKQEKLYHEQIRVEKKCSISIKMRYKGDYEVTATCTINGTLLQQAPDIVNRYAPPPPPNAAKVLLNRLMAKNKKKKKMNQQNNPLYNNENIIDLEDDDEEEEEVQFEEGGYLWIPLIPPLVVNPDENDTNILETDNDDYDNQTASSSIAYSEPLGDGEIEDNKGSQLEELEEVNLKKPKARICVRIHTLERDDYTGIATEWRIEVIETDGADWWVRGQTDPSKNNLKNSNNNFKIEKKIPHKIKSFSKKVIGDDDGEEGMRIEVLWQNSFEIGLIDWCPLILNGTNENNEEEISKNITRGSLGNIWRPYQKVELNLTSSQTENQSFSSSQNNQNSIYSNNTLKKLKKKDKEMNIYNSKPIVSMRHIPEKELMRRILFGTKTFDDNKLNNTFRVKYDGLWKDQGQEKAVVLSSQDPTYSRVNDVTSAEINSEEVFHKLLLEEEERRREQLEAEERERRLMTKEEEFTLRNEEVFRRLLERKHRDFQEKGHRLYQHCLGSLVRCPRNILRMQWVRALLGEEAGESLSSQVRDPADGKMYLFKHLVCQYDDDVTYALKELSVFEDELYRCPYLMKIVASSTSFATPFVSGSTGQYSNTTRSLIVVASFLPGGLVADKCKWGSEIDNDSVVRWSRDVAAGLKALHAKKLIHRNLNPRNVHIDAQARAVITGYQVLKNPRIVGDEYSFGRADCGSTMILSPEVDDGFPLTAAADIWALGCCIYAWVTGDSTGMDCSNLRDKTLDEILRRIPRRFGSKLRSALRMCLQHHPDKRANAKEVWNLLSTSER